MRIFQETKKAVLIGDSAAIRNLSNQTNNTAALTQDPDNIAAAVIIYSLSRIIEKYNYKKFPGWNNFYRVYTGAIDRIIDSIKRKDDEAFRKDITVIRKAIETISGKLKTYIQEVFRRASINKASKLYEHGLSIEKTASLLGISLFEIADYAGAKELADTPQIKTVDVKTRIKMAMEMFE